MSPDSGFGIPGWFIAIFVVILVLGIASAVWRISVVRKIARNAGLDENQAAAVTMLSDDGIEAAYLASTFAARNRPQHAPAVTQQPKTAEERLQELASLRSRGLVTDEEYEAQRRAILGSI